ncbi:MFS transporter [Colletotrichum higginsianum]|nr:MFS transporter [Colletotrichum higginsianum]
MITRAALPWYTFYYFVIGISVVEILALTGAFWNHTGLRYREQMACSPGAHEKSASIRRVLTKQPEARIAWLSALFVLVYIGVEVSLGGWIVEFLLHVRKGEAFASGMGATGYWLGITLGRILLPFVTNLIGLKIAVTVYLTAAMAAELVFWLVPNFYASIIAVGLQGFFIGPMFPHAISAVTSLLPQHLHVVLSLLLQIEFWQIEKPINRLLQTFPETNLGFMAELAFCFPRVWYSSVWVVIRLRPVHDSHLRATSLLRDDLVDQAGHLSNCGLFLTPYVDGA